MDYDEIATIFGQGRHVSRWYRIAKELTFGESWLQKRACTTWIYIN